MEDSSSTGKVVGALLIGAAIGATLGILFAPDKGSETRRKISAKGTDLNDNFKEKINEFFSELQNKFETIKENTQESMENNLNKAEKAIQKS